MLAAPPPAVAAWPAAQQPGPNRSMHSMRSTAHSRSMSAVSSVAAFLRCSAKAGPLPTCTAWGSGASAIAGEAGLACTLVQHACKSTARAEQPAHACKGQAPAAARRQQFALQVVAPSHSCLEATTGQANTQQSGSSPAGASGKSNAAQHNKQQQSKAPHPVRLPGL